MTAVTRVRTLSRKRDVRNAVICWAVLWLSAAIPVLLGNQRTVTGAYRAGAASWLQGTDLYNGTGIGFIYFPHAAVLFAPFACLAHDVGEVLWRSLTVAFFAWGVFRLSRLADRRTGVSLLGLATLVCVPLVWSSARNGQATLLLAGLMMLAAVDLAGQRWWCATLWIVVGLAAKPLMIVLLLLAFALHAPMRARLAAGLAALCLVPFLFQSPAYVWSQYLGCVQMLHDANRFGNEGHWAQLFGMLKVFGWEIPGTVQTLCRALAAVATYGVCRYALGHLRRGQVHLHLFAVAACYLMLFNPRTENNTYSLMSPALAVVFAQTLLVERRYRMSIVYALLAAGVLGSFEFASLVLPREPAVWLAPLCCLLFIGLLMTQLFRAQLPQGSVPETQLALEP